MIRGIKLVGMAVVAVLALGLVGVASASATALIHFSSTGSFSGKGGEAKLETSNGKLVTCKKGTAKGNVTSEEHGTVLIEFEECTTKVSIVTAKCTTTESKKTVGTEGNIHVLALILLGSDTAPPEDKPAVLIQPENSSGASIPTTFSCSALGQTAELTVEGSVIGLVKNTTTSGKKTIELSLAKGSKTGEQQDKHFWDESETGIENFLTTTSEGAEKFTKLESSEEATATLESANEIQIET
jgi:predicted dehydrogenase